MKYNRQILNSFLTKTLLPLLCIVMVNTIGYKSYGKQDIMQDSVFIQSYENYYDLLKNAGINIIESQLQSNIHEFVTSGDHVKTQNYDYKVRRINKELIQQLKSKFCNNKNLQNAGQLEKNYAIYEILLDLNEKNNLQAPLSLYGAITALSVLYIETIELTNFCDQSKR